MRTYPECYPCFMRQAVRTVKKTGGDNKVAMKVVKEVADRLPHFNPGKQSPPEFGEEIQAIIREVTENDDPFASLKQKSTDEALELYPELKKMIKSADDPLMKAIRLAIAGNIIDFGTMVEFDLGQTIQRVLYQEIAINDIEQFRMELGKANSILYIGDNAGETVFDKLLIEQLDKPVTYAVKNSPVLNDATRLDAEAAYIHTVANIIESGSTAPGTVPKSCNSGFLELLDNADMVISKGQGNYETLDEYPRPIYFLLQTKCGVISEALDVPEKSIILKYTGNKT